MDTDLKTLIEKLVSSIESIDSSLKSVASSLSTRRSNLNEENENLRNRLRIMEKENTVLSRTLKKMTGVETFGISKPTCKCGRVQEYDESLGWVCPICWKEDSRCECTKWENYSSNNGIYNEYLTKMSTKK